MCFIHFENLLLFSSVECTLVIVTRIPIQATVKEAYFGKSARETKRDTKAGNRKTIKNGNCSLF